MADVDCYTIDGIDIPKALSVASIRQLPFEPLKGVPIPLEVCLRPEWLADAVRVFGSDPVLERLQTVSMMTIWKGLWDGITQKYDLTYVDVRKYLKDNDITYRPTSGT